MLIFINNHGNVIKIIQLDILEKKIEVNLEKEKRRRRKANTRNLVHFFRVGVGAEILLLLLRYYNLLTA